MANTPKSKSSKTPPKRWIFHGILADTPISTEDAYYSQEELSEVLKSLIRFPGLRLASLRLQELPPRKKKTT